jgi:glycosyltransferase involved in cell wall biosynthesis
MHLRHPLESERRAAAPKAAVRRAPRAHICFLAPTTWPVLSGDPDIPVVGGAEVQQSMIAPALAARGYRVSMICHDYGQPEKAEVRGITVYRMHKPDEGIPVVRFIHPRLTSLWQALARVDADVYYQRSAAAWTGFLAAFCRKHHRRAIYAGASDVDFLPGKQDIRFARDRWIFEWGLRRMDSIVVQNQAQREQLRTHYGLDSTLIPSCYAPPPGAKADRAGYVLWAATVRPSKRAEMFLEIARRMPRQRFVMVGGPDPGARAEAYYRAVIEAARAIPNIDVKGFVPFAQAERYFDGARVLLNTSLYEGFPNTFLQAWARGIPTVSSFDTGSRRGGAPVYDLVTDLSQASWRLDRLMGDDIVWRDASQRVNAHFRACHSVEAIAERYEHEIERVRGTR